MSTMYRATDVRLGRKVALKVIAGHLNVDAEFRERFVDEARNTSAIDHSHVVPLYDFGETDGYLYIAMRFVDGADLASLIKDGPIAPARALTLLQQVAEALDNLHGKGLVHLDIKPANVLVTTRESSGEHVYLADFGLTRRGATGHRTRGGDFLGSPTYAAPEHLRGEPVDPRTDAYSLACVLFACLTGRPPYQGKVPEVIQGHLATEPPAVTSLVVLPPAVDAVVRRGMSKDPAKRFANCQELVAAARSALASVPAPGTPPQVRAPGSAPAAPSPTGSHPGTGPHPAQRPPTGPIPVQQAPHPTGPSPVPPQPYPAPAGYPQRPGQPAEPVRLRPPMAVAPTAFGNAASEPGGRWLIPLLSVAALAVVVVVIILLVV
ncbi:serine/threonine-protein kinase [Crossiella equi]|uniref:non-specific serine/threonine protein kinase n=2 Tax=Crossiella equi TaxID=130796 RepID=A0ABS5AEQ8_9PSEU|nr:serine/threonine-protein kinase [Crossiella equi]